MEGTTDHEKKIYGVNYYFEKNVNLWLGLTDAVLQQEHL